MNEDVCEIPLTKGKTALVDAADFAAVSAYNWHATKTKHNRWYAVRSIRDPNTRKVTSQPLHRFLMPECPAPQIDHINGNGLDCRRANMRPATHAQNQCNKRPRSDNSSGFKGVIWNKQANRWTARIRINGKTTWLGNFIAKVEAARAYDVAALNLHKEFAWLNFPELIAGSSTELREDCVRKCRERPLARAKKLTAEDILAIRKRYSQGESQQAIGRAFGVTQAMVWRVVHRLRWKHVP